jgi:nucleoid-associated protein YgaU
MQPGRALLFLSFAIPLFPSKAWSKGRKPPESTYNIQDQHSLNQMMMKPGASDEASAPAPAPAPMKLKEAPPVEEAAPAPVPAPEPEPAPVKVEKALPPSPERVTEAKPVPLKNYRVWIWQENGDTLWRIAQKVYGDKDKWPLIYQANKDVIKDPNKIYPKQVLKIPPVDWQP